MVGAVPGESKVKSSQVREPALGPWPRNHYEKNKKKHVAKLGGRVAVGGLHKALPS